MSQYSDASSSPRMTNDSAGTRDDDDDMSTFKFPTSSSVDSTALRFKSTRATAKESSKSFSGAPIIPKSKRKPPRLDFTSSNRDYTAPLNDMNDTKHASNDYANNVGGSTTRDGEWNYTANQVQLPRHASAAAGLSSSGYASSAPSLQRTPSIDRPQGTYDHRNPSVIEYSPVLDRSNLIGLGELATPRWTTTMLAASRYQSTGAEHELRYDDGLPDPDMMSQHRPFAAGRELSMNSIASSSSPIFHPSTLFANESTSYRDFSLGPPGQPDLPNMISSSFSLDAVSDAEADAVEAEAAVIATNDSPRPYRSRMELERLAASTLHLDTSTQLSQSTESTPMRNKLSSRRRSSEGKSERQSEASSEVNSTKKMLVHHRRQSASKSGFAHLPPSPASTTPRGISSTPIVSHSSSTNSLPRTTSTSTTPNTNTPTTTTSRTPDQKRISAKSSYSHLGQKASPSAIAASILRQNRQMEYDDVSMTSEALHKLDGFGSITSPRVSRTLDHRSSKPHLISNMIPRPTSRAGSMLGSRKNSSSNLLVESFDSLSVRDDRPSSSVSDRIDHVKRGSSSGTVGTSGTVGSRESTSATSMSSSYTSNATSNTNAIAIVKANKLRRGSETSDTSAYSSSISAGAERSDSEVDLEFVPPPVPPIPRDYIPKDYEKRPTDIRRPSESSFTETGLLEEVKDVEVESVKERRTTPRKWSLSGAFGKSKSKSSLQGSASFSDLATAASAKTETPTSRTRLLSMHSLSDRRMAASTNDIARLAASSADTTKQATTTTAKGKNRPSSSSSSNSNSTAIANLVLPSLKGTTSGQSRSSLPSPRGTPSGIPFFSRKSASSTPATTSATPLRINSISKTTSSLPSSSSSKSILGLNFLRSTASRREKEKLVISAPALRQIRQSAFASSSATKVDDEVDEMGRSLAPRKENRISLRDRTPVKSTRTRPEAIKAGLPTIDGSPSKPSRLSPRPSDTTRLSPRPSDTMGEANEERGSTPTKIPRLFPRQHTSPKSSLSQSTSYTGIAPTKSSRRLSYLGTEINEFGANREPGLGLGEKTLSSRRRQNGDSSQIPRTRSTTLIMARTRDFGASEGLQSSASTSRNGTRLSVDPTEVASPRSSARLSSSTIESRRTPSRTIEGPPAVTPRRTSAYSSTLSSVSNATSTSNSMTMLSNSGSMATGISRIAGPSRVPRSTIPAESARSISVSSQRSNIVSDEELRGDEEMSAYVRRQQTKKLAGGMSTELIRKMFEFPEPTVPRQVLSTRDAMSLHSRSLTNYEKEEIREHEKIYYVGSDCQKRPASREVVANNHGYDDDRGDYLLVPHDHILYRYEVIDVLGKGSFGQVLQCRDHRTGDMVAIKIIRNKKRFHQQALVEIKVLENLVKWDPEETHYVIRMVDSFTFRGHLCIVTELLSINLYELIKANSFVGFSTALIRRFTVQILESLSLLRQHRVVHCDLKPENILLKHPAKSAIKVIDFGSSCFEHEKVYTYIQSRFYRSPEIILGMNYHMAIDMWSLGCILAEMFTGFPIFPGENEQEQLSCITEVLGVPDKHLVDKSSRRKIFFDSTGTIRPVVNSKGRRRRPGSKTLAQILKSDDELFVDFISKCLSWDPDRRMKPDAATRHPWILAGRSRSTSQPPIIPPRGISRPAVISSALANTISSPRKRLVVSSSDEHHPTLPIPPSMLTSQASKSLPANSLRYSIKS